MAFRRKAEPIVSEPIVSESIVPEPESATGDESVAHVFSRVDGPWDLAEVSDNAERIDFGALQFTPRDGLEVQVQVDQETGQVLFVTAVLGGAAAQIHVFAAPRSSGIWSEVRDEIKVGITASGGLVEEATGAFGLELRARVPQGPGSTMQPARFVGVDGPRWFLRAILLGDAALPGDGAAAIEEVVRSVVVVRGNEAMAPREQIPLHVPGQESGSHVAGIDPFVRGPEITEVR